VDFATTLAATREIDFSASLLVLPLDPSRAWCRPNQNIFVPLPTVHVNRGLQSLEEAPGVFAFGKTAACPESESP
jgi:hypothetical protein